MPALAAGQEMQERAAALGYDWPSIEGVLDKVAEELGELAAAADARRSATRSSATCCSCVVNVGRKLGIEAEAAAARRERASSATGSAAWSGWSRERGVALRDLDFAALDDLWDAAKAEERAAAAARPVAANEGAAMSIGNRPPSVRADGRRPATCVR